MIKKILKFLKYASLIFFGSTIFMVILYRFVPVPVTPLMIIKGIETGNMSWKHDWVPLEDISSNLQIAVIASEDQNFLNHHGFDFDAMKKAMEHNKKGKKIKGGSTISQQTAKNVFLWPGRSYIRKGFEAYFTTLIELFWGKERIMEVYLNSIEMGKGVYGAEEAAKHWYGKSAKKLSKYEAAGIAAILPNPVKYKASNSGPYVEKRKSQITRQMGYLGKLNY